MTSLPPAEAAAHVLVDDVGLPVLDDAAAHHLRRVRRLDVGSACTATDGKGAWRACRLSGSDALEIVGEVIEVARPTPLITIAFALTKAHKPEIVVQKLTELGVDRIIPFRADRSVVRWDDRKADAQRRRWHEIARGAIEQSRSVWMPSIEGVGTIDDVIALGAARLDRGGSAPTLARSVVAVGPEGGWSENERRRLPSVVDLGPNVLRAETAALTAGGILCALRSGIVQESVDFSTERGK